MDLMQRFYRSQSYARSVLTFPSLLGVPTLPKSKDVARWAWADFTTQEREEIRGIIQDQRNAARLRKWRERYRWLEERG